MSTEVALVMDIGGTHARLALVRREGLRVELGETRMIMTPSGSLADPLRAFLDEQQVRCTVVAAAVAGVIDGEGINASVRMTNQSLTVSAQELGEIAGGVEAHLVNDLAAVAYAIPELDQDRVRWIGRPRPQRIANCAVLGAGTGIGIAARLAQGSIISGEGGHSSAALFDEVALRLHAAGAWSIEEILAGSRLPIVFTAVTGKPAPESPEEVVRMAQAADQGALATVHWYWQALASVCGDCALLMGAWGGLYLSGAVLGSLADWLHDPTFRKQFSAKPKFSDRLDSVPISIITHPYPALLGLGRLALFGR